MSELITASPEGIFPTFGLEVISQGPVTLRSGPNAPPGRIEAIGSSLDDIIRPIAADSTTPLTIGGREGNDQLSGAAGDDRIFGETGDDTIVGRGGNDVISGGDGIDQLFGDVGDDEIFGDAGNDAITGGDGNDRVFGNEGNDTVSGGEGDDTVQGGLGDDRLSGDAGNDRLIAGRGVDILIGGAGRDTFVFGRRSTPTEIDRNGRTVEQPDRIVDFNPRQDVIVLDRSLVAGLGLSVGSLDRSDFAIVDRITNSNRSDITAKIVYERNSGTVSLNRGDGDISPLLRLGRDLPLTASDFEIGVNVDGIV